MRIAVGSQSTIKIKAVRDALSELGIDAEVVGVKAASNVPEQPQNDEGVLAARNRVAHAKQLDSTADVYLAIENFIREQDGRFVDIGVVLASTRDGREQVSYSNVVEFPRAFVEEARRRGFDKITVGKLMAEQGIVAAHDDPHLTLTGKPRAQFLTETVSKALGALLLCPAKTFVSPGAK